jgi:hypothetical protein
MFRNFVNKLYILVDVSRIEHLFLVATSASSCVFSISTASFFPLDNSFYIALPGPETTGEYEVHNNLAMAVWPFSHVNART